MSLTHKVECTYSRAKNKSRLGIAVMGRSKHYNTGHCQAYETSDVTTKDNSVLIYIHETPIFGHSLNGLGQGTGNKVFYAALACSYSMFYSSIV